MEILTPRTFWCWLAAGALLGASGVAGLSAWAAEVATVNGNVITDKDIASSLTGLNEGQREEVLRDSNSRREILTGLINQEVLVEQAQRQKLDQDQQYRDAMNAFRRQYLANRVLQQNLGSKLTDAAARKYYQAHQERFSTDQVHAMHILAATEGQARNLMKLAKENDTDEGFEQLAAKYSKDPSAKNNRGDLGFFGRDRMVPAFTDAAFAAHDGEIVGPVKTAYGYHIIRVVKKRFGKPLNYDEVELKVKNDLRQILTENYVGKLRAQAKVKVNQDAVDKM